MVAKAQTLEQDFLLLIVERVFGQVKEFRGF